jgi:diaminohydroxyphosphoribosylaminopyrimidine deaminase / 5-amino-6-(5-phosphoribosylamino)uracil reductase
MRAALAEAAMGLGRTAPNPAVGAVIIRNGRIIARGFHSRAGAPHAEIEALGALANPERARGATLVVTLEPCSTRGRTPACTDAIQQAGIARVVYGATDPNPAHAGRAKHILEAAGISVMTGVLAEECMALNRAWNTWISTGMPFVTAKAGMSLDGRIKSTPRRRWITCEKARADAMGLRAEVDAVLIGGQTLRDDNPRLTVRGISGARNPLRVVWSRTGNLPKNATLFQDGLPTRVFSGVSLRATLRQLAREGIQSVLIEGGARTLGEAFHKHLVHRVVFYVAPTLIGGPVPTVGGSGFPTPQAAIQTGPISAKRVGKSLRVEATVRPVRPVRPV